MTDLAPTLDVDEATRVLTAFLSHYVRASGAEGVVLGLSGGIDSALVAAVAVRALGPDRVLGVLLPHRDSNAVDEAHALLVAEKFGFETERIDISPVTDAVLASCTVHAARGGLAEVNVKPRARMMILYAHSNAMNRLVLGTGNKSELLVGYFTKYGDGAADAYPIGDLYKTQVFALARHLRVPDVIVDKAPTAGLWDGQTDEDELGISYALLDRILSGIESGLDDAALKRRAGADAADIKNVRARIARSAHKRNPLVIPKLGFRTPGLDWREPRIKHVE